MNPHIIYVDYTRVWGNMIKQTTKAQLNTKSGTIVEITDAHDPKINTTHEVTSEYITFKNHKIPIKNNHANTAALDYLTLLQK